MSSSSSPVAGGGPPPLSASHYLRSLGPGYAIAVAFAFLVLLSTVILSSYFCCRRRRRRRRGLETQNPNPSSSVSENGIVLPRIIFVAEDDDDGGGNEHAVVGLDHAVINLYPKFPFSRDFRGGGGVNDSMCSICLCEYRDAEMLRMLPDCRHFFHLTCVDAWLKLNASCPVCRNSPLPTPLSTPLSEVVPLSQYSDGRRR